MRVAGNKQINKGIKKYFILISTRTKTKAERRSNNEVEEGFFVGEEGSGWVSLRG